MSSPPSYCYQDVVDWLGEAEVRQAEPLVGTVGRLRWSADGCRLQGEVRDPAQLCQVDIDFSPPGPAPRRRLLFDCSCPLGYACKHCAALLLAALRQAPPEPQREADPAVLAWLREFEARQGKRAAAPRGMPVRLFYLLHFTPRGDGLVSFCKARPQPDGRLAQHGEPWNNLDGALRRPAGFIDADDRAILQLLQLQAPAETWLGGGYPLAGCNDQALLERLLATERCYLDDGRLGLVGPLRAGPARPASLCWRHDEQARQRPELAIEPAGRTLRLERPAYLDIDTAQVGPLLLDGDWPLLRELLTIPPLGAFDLPLVAEALRPYLPEPALPAAAALPTVDAAPVPVLLLDSLPVQGINGYRGYGRQFGAQLFDLALPRFDYGGHLVQAGDGLRHVQDANGRALALRRDPDREAAWLKALAKAGLKPVPASKLFASAQWFEAARGLHGLARPEDWPLFMRDALPRLVEQGWRIEVRDGFRHWAPEPTDWRADVAEDEHGYALALTVEFDGQHLPLAPMLADLVQREPHWLLAERRALLPDETPVMLRGAMGRRVKVPAGRIKPLLATLAELFEQANETTLRLPLLDAPRLVEALEGWQADGLEAARRMADTLRQAGAVEPVAPPAGLALTLRPYQLQGLAWLQYLRRHGLAGILADDMGLGKTVQALAHLLLEKEAGRLDRPALVVLPTSLVPNWRHEAQRFAPSLRLLALHGPQRARDFDRIGEHDLVLTTYPLLWRDLDALARHDYHLLILDEAQAVKNAASRSADAVRALRARHRLAITGTPLENHLGELWAQFDFLLPGFLGDARAFARLWRTPIEQHGDAERHALLARRIRPFVLRRRKDEVARELPAKTVVVREVELGERQRELYETVRAALDAKVREAVAGKGFARSRIEILDALLKLRQVCCDPRLLKQDSARAVDERAKLDALMAMLPELVEEGRRVLVFSQFASMLALIEAELQAAGLGYLLLTGDTADRATPVRRFQDGEAPIFLISLKAGGVGLNLTAADTVIHFDPWWNPAAENQATDRAHRIGQDKPVFVYKLVAAGSIEERILALQERKAALAAGVLADRAGELPVFDEGDLAALLAPLGS